MIRYKCPKCGTDMSLVNEMLYKFIACRSCHWTSQVFGPNATFQPDPRGNEVVPPMLRTFMSDCPRIEKPTKVENEDFLIIDENPPAQDLKSQPTVPKPSDLLGKTTHASDDKYRSKYDNAPKPYNPNDLLKKTPAQSEGHAGKTAPLTDKPSSRIGKATHASDDKYKSKYDKQPKPPTQSRPITQPQQPQSRQDDDAPPPFKNYQSNAASRKTSTKIIAPEARAAMTLAAIGVFASCLVIGGLFSFISLIASKVAATKIKQFPEYYEGENVIIMSRIIAVIGLIISIIAFAKYTS